MLLCYFKRFIDAFTNCNTGDNDNILTPAILLIQLKHSLDIGVGFANTGFHFNSQIESALKLRRGCNLIGSLNFLYMFQDNRVGKFRHQFLVAPTCELVVLINIKLISTCTSVHHIGRRQIWLSCKNVYYRFRSISLKLLMFELQFHLPTSLDYFYSCIRC